MIFTIEWYGQQKELGKSDIEIADSLFVSYGTLHNLKKRHGWKAGQGKVHSGRKQQFDPAEIRQLKESGLSYQAIMKHVGCGRATVFKYTKGMNRTCQ